MNKFINRRTALRGLANGIGLLIAGKAVGMTRNECSNILTPAQTEGPFYPKKRPKHLDVDMVRIAPSGSEAEGVRILIEGKVSNQWCEPVSGVLIDIWQACHSGRYNHPNDPNPAPLDPHFQYAAEVLTRTDGGFRIRTVVPGAYPASHDWIRPPHIHMKITKLGFKELTTQVYFDRFKELNDADLILRQLDTTEKNSVIMMTEGAVGQDTDLGPVELKAKLNLTITQLQR